jgi:hypothetical protein
VISARSPRRIAESHSSQFLGARRAQLCIDDLLRRAKPLATSSARERAPSFRNKDSMRNVTVCNEMSSFRAATLVGCIFSAEQSSIKLGLHRAKCSTSHVGASGPAIKRATSANVGADVALSDSGGLVACFMASRPPSCAAPPRRRRLSCLASVMTVPRSLWLMCRRCCNHHVPPSFAAGRASSALRPPPIPETAPALLPC